MTEEGPNGIRKVFTDHAHGIEEAISRLNHSEKEALANALRKLGYANESRVADDITNSASKDSNGGQNLSQSPSSDR